MRLREFRPQRDGALRGFDRLLRAAKGAVNRAEIGQRLDIIGFGGDGAGDEIRRGVMIAAIMRDEAEMMQAEEMAGLGGEHPGVDLFRRAMAPGAKTFEREHEGRFDRRGWPCLRRVPLRRRFAFALQRRHRPSPPQARERQS